MCQAAVLDDGEWHGAFVRQPQVRMHESVLKAELGLSVVGQILLPPLIDAGYICGDPR